MKHGQHGSAMVLAIFVLVLLTSLGIALLFVSQNELRLAQANLRTKSVFYLAESGVEDGRRTLYDLNDTADFDADLARAAGENGTIDIDSRSLRPVFDGDGNPTGVVGAGDDEPLRGMTALGDGYYVAYLTNDALEGRSNLDDENHRVVLTAIGIGSKNAFEVVEAVLEPEDPPLPEPPAAGITIVGPTPDFTSGTSDNSEYNGTDCAGAGESGLHVPTLGVIGPEAETSAEAGVYTGETESTPGPGNGRGRKGKGKPTEEEEASNDGPEFTSGPYTDLDTIADLTDTRHPLVSAPPDPTWTDCQALHDLIESLRDRATHLCSGTDCALPATTMESVTFIDNGMGTTVDYDFAVSSGDADGAGILVVTGKLNFNGQRSWDGIILVVGQGHMLRDGAGNGTISGSVIIADIAGEDNLYGTDDDCGNGFEIGTFDVNGGGTASVNYCSDDINAANSWDTYEITNFLQH